MFVAVKELTNPNTVSSMVVSFSLFLFFTTLFFLNGSAQNSTTATPTDPSEGTVSSSKSKSLTCFSLSNLTFFFCLSKCSVEAVNTIFRKWRISSDMSRIRWNTTDGNPCTGAAVDSVDDVKANPENYGLNPSVFCDCDEIIYHIIKM